MLEFNTLDDFDFGEKTVLLRVDFNLPLDKKTMEILDTTRIKQALPTIKELIEKKAKVVILAHQGRPGSWDFISLDKHAKALSDLLGKTVQFVDDIYGEKAKDVISSAKPGDVILLDNVRKVPEEMEKKSAEEHAKSAMVKVLSSLADVFVNDAFAAAHRKQCSLIGFTAVLPSCAGRLMEKELVTLGKLLSNPDKPSLFLFGGAKYSDVVKTIERSLQNGIADEVILTGLPANAFLKAREIKLGSVNEEILKEEESPELMEQIKKLSDEFNGAIKLPIDFAVEKDGKRVEISIEELPTEYPIYDIGLKSIEQFIESIKKAHTIFISGPCGVFEKKEFLRGTKEILTAIANSDAFSIVGGGHTVAAVEMLGLSDKISHISTGGGSLEKFMMGESLPVVEALKAAKR
ncbi:MAG TPA: phosphoglycerate kinase [Thermoplasmatales archaeon]|nr:phosphoglycerate kinase [Thermoplasmatales archaeon]